MSTEYGHHSGWVYISQDGKLIVPSSAYIRFEDGGWSNVLYVETTTTGISLPFHGYSVIHTTQLTVHPLSQPPRGGIEKVIVFDSSAVIKVRSEQSIAAGDVKFGSSAVSIGVSSDLGKVQKVLGRAPVLRLISESSAKWHVLQPDLVDSTGPNGAGGNFWIVSTST